jgi:hypothetical protein
LLSRECTALISSASIARSTFTHKNNQQSSNKQLFLYLERRHELDELLHLCEDVVVQSQRRAQLLLLLLRLLLRNRTIFLTDRIATNE